MKDMMREMIAGRKRGEKCGIASFCTANELVIEACMEQARENKEAVLIEATANQVNQFGGYTGMKPADFRKFVFEIADRVQFPRELILLGGDHLGPLAWQSETEEEAMKKSIELVKQYVAAGFKKIHLDTSMKLADDSKEERLKEETVAQRGALLYRACEESYQELLQKNEKEIRPVYIIGSEVPVPGGSVETESAITVTSPEALQITLEAYRKAFTDMGMEEQFKNVIGVVVQPGVEFGDDTCFVYNRENARALTKAANELEGIVLEGHSTDYQPPKALKQMVEDGIAILKVGPALTFGLREGLFALDAMEKKLVSKEKRGNFVEVLEQAMVANPHNWEKYYDGDEHQKAIKRQFSYSDRIRYYLTNPAVKEAMNRLLENMDKASVPMGMLHQYMPLQYVKVRDGQLSMRAKALVKDSVITFAGDYQYAVHPE